MSESPEKTDSESSQAGGLKASLRALLATTMAIVETRLALFATELEEERQRLLATLAWGAVAVLLGCFALAFAAGLIAAAFWDTHRLLALGAMTGVFLVLCLVAVWRVRRLIQSSSGLLSATLAELEADRRALSPKGRS
ncbi:MAG TPA: phage holin family protein [Aquabacterium sp.]|nr:phage holin family protein [Aquabacterium sp.]